MGHKVAYKHDKMKTHIHNQLKINSLYFSFLYNKNEKIYMIYEDVSNVTLRFSYLPCCIKL